MLIQKSNAIAVIPLQAATNVVHLQVRPPVPLRGSQSDRRERRQHEKRRRRSETERRRLRDGLRKH